MGYKAFGGLCITSYRSVVPCDFESNLKFINKDGTSGYWNSIQVAESNTAIKSLQISHSGQEDWQPLQLKPESNFCKYILTPKTHSH